MRKPILLVPVWPERGAGRFLGLLERVSRMWPEVEGEVRVSPGGWDAAAAAVEEFRRAGFVVAAHLPPPEESDPAEAARWLREVRPAWAVVHGGTAREGEVEDCADFVEFLRDRASRLRKVASSGVTLYVENVPPREPVRDPADIGRAAGVRYLVRAGMFARDLLFLCRACGTGALLDTEHLLDAVACVREAAVEVGRVESLPDERAFAGMFGFVVREGRVFWAGDCLRGLTLAGEAALLRPARVHVTGSTAALRNGAVTSHAELRAGDPFGEYVLRFVLGLGPASVTVESCHEGGTFDFGVLERSVLYVTGKLAERPVLVTRK